MIFYDHPHHVVNEDLILELSWLKMIGRSRPGSRWLSQGLGGLSAKLRRFGQWREQEACYVNQNAEGIAEGLEGKRDF